MTPFEDLIWLFTSDKSTRGICRLNIAEAALLYKYCKAKKDSHILEIGRKFAGSTVVMASALDQGHVTSVDVVTHQKAIENTKPFGKKVRFIESDSRHLTWKDPIGLLFIDGDHHPNVVKLDVKNFSPHVEVGGHMVFHDANKADINKIIQRTMKHKNWEREAQADLLVVLTRVGK